MSMECTTGAGSVGSVVGVEIGSVTGAVVDGIRSSGVVAAIPAVSIVTGTVSVGAVFSLHADIRRHTIDNNNTRVIRILEHIGSPPFI
jgi:hypothetical protein